MSPRKSLPPLPLLIIGSSKSWQPKKNATRKLRVKPLRPGAVLAFGEFLEKCNWSSLLSITDVNNKVDAFLKFTHDSIDSFFPTKTVKIHEEDKPFITGKIKKLISKRNKAYKSGNTALYKRLRNQILSDVRIAKQNFYHDHVRPAFCKDHHVWWKISIKSLGKRNRLLHFIITDYYIDPETDLLLDEKQSANHINDFSVSLTKDFTEVTVE